MKHEEVLAPMEELVPLIRDALSRGQTVRISPRGVSMLPMLRQGTDSVELSPIPEKLRKFDLPLYQRQDGTYVLHRIVDAQDTYTCMGDNQFTAEHGLRPEQMLAVVTAFYRGEKKHSVREPGYWLYCRLWHCSRPLRKLWRKGVNRLRRLLTR